MVTHYEFNVKASFMIRNALDKFLGIIGADFLFPTVDGGLTGIVSGNGFKPVVRVTL
jgi:hypothetical protein